MHEQSYDYGDCHVCGEQMVAQVVDQEFRFRDQLMVIANVPAGVCPRCGAKVVNAEVGLRIADLTAAVPLPAHRIIQVPVIDFVAKAA